MRLVDVQANIVPGVFDQPLQSAAAHSTAASTDSSLAHAFVCQVQAPNPADCM
jgi:hypothetical protein